jgi:hypothetical protein
MTHILMLLQIFERRLKKKKGRVGWKKFGRNLKKWLGDRKSGSLGSEVNVELSVRSTAFKKEEGKGWLEEI